MRTFWSALKFSLQAIFAFRLPLSDFSSGFGRDGALGQIVFQQTRMANEGGVEGGSGDVKTRKAVENAQAEEIGAEETPKGTECGLGRVPA